MKEIWKPIKGYKGYYEASNMGRIRSLDRYVKNKNGVKNFLKGKVLKTAKHNHGYLKVNLSKNNKIKTFYVHRLVYESFYGKKSLKYLEIDHINGNKVDNRLINLRFATKSQNGSNRAKCSFKTSSKYKGVYWNKGAYTAQIFLNKKNYYLGRFKCEKSAALAYNKKAVEFFGKFAILNEVEK